MGGKLLQEQSLKQQIMKELKLSQSNRIFRPNEPLEGKIITKLPSSISHNGIRLTVNGSVTLQVSDRVFIWCSQAYPNCVRFNVCGRPSFGVCFRTPRDWIIFERF